MKEFALQFIHPELLLLLIPALALPRWRFRRGGVWFFSAVLAAGVLALAEPVLIRRVAPETLVLYDLDRGSTPDAALKKHPGARLVTFRGDPRSALADAGARLQYGGGTIHLYGGVDDPDGAVERQTQLLNRRKIPVFVHNLPRRVPDRPELCRIAAPPASGVGETAEIEAEVFFPDDRPAECVLENGDGGVAARGSAPATPGVRRFKLRLTPERPGEFTYTLKVAGMSEAVPLRVDPAFRVLVFTERGTEAREIAALFAPAASVEVYDGTQDIPKYPLLVFGAGGVDGIPAKAFEDAVRAVGRGSGVLFFAEKAPPFRPDRVSPGFARLLPLAYRAGTRKRLPDVALVIIIDTSGSMSGGRLELAREVARLAADKLRDRDKCGVLEFHGRRRWAAPLQSAANRLELHRALNRLSSGGGTLILPALREAYYALRNTEARAKHVLVITDGGVERGDFESLIREMARHDITVSSVMVGAGDSEFLFRLALWGNGRFYRAANRFAVPELSFRQSGTTRMPPWKEGVFAVVPDKNAPLAAQLHSKMSVAGVMESEALPGTQVLLTAGSFPLLARGNAGGGCAVLNLAPDGKWGEKTLRGPEFRALVGALARSLPDPVRMRRYDFRDHSRRRRLHVVIDREEMPERLYLRSTSPDGKVRRFVLEPEADGACHFRLADAAVGIHTLEVAADPGFGDASSVRVVSRRAPLLLTRDGEHAAAERIDRRSRRLAPPTGRRKDTPLRPVCGGLFIVLLLGQLLWRRLPRRAASLLLIFLTPAMLYGAPAKTPGASFRVSQKPGKGAFSVVTLRVATLKLPMPSFLRSIENPPAATFCSAALSAGGYEECLRRGLSGSGDRMAALQEAEKLSSTPADRRFARILLVEEARRQKRLPELLARFEPGSAADPELLTLVVNELEDRGDAAAALRMLEKHADTGSPAVIRQMLRLAQKCGPKETEALRLRVRERLRREPESAQWLDAALRLELLAGRRDEAAGLFRRTVGSASSREFVSAAAGVAEKLMLYAEAEFALRRLESLSPDDLWPCRFRLVSLLRNCGSADKATALLRKYAALPALPPHIVLSVADRCERLGDSDTALKLYLECGTCEALIRRAMLLEGGNRFDDASAAWLDIVRHADNDMRSLQATDRLIALEKRRKNLDGLCRGLVAMPERRSEARLSRLYLRALAAAGREEELFSELDKTPGSWRTRLDFLLEFKRWDEAMKSISARIADRPEERGTLLRQQAVIALESGDAKAAEAVVSELLKDPADRFAVAAFAAEAYMRVKSPERAAELYAECLKLAPERYELHLLRANALAAAGRKDEALAFFRARLAEDAPPEKFCVMVDGLLNLNASPEVLKLALAQVLERIGNAPEQLLYYRLAEDLADELADAELRRKLMLMQLAVAPERREMLLRELFEDARLRDDRIAAEHFARLLVALNGVYPPELRRELGRSLAASEGGFAAAERSARSADDHTASTQKLFLFVDSCLDMMRPADALRICRELLSLTPDDEAVLAKYALVLELCGDFRAAGEIRERQLELHAARRVYRSGKASPPTPEEKRLISAVAAHRVLAGAPPLPPVKKNSPTWMFRLLTQRAEEALRRTPRTGFAAKNGRAAPPPPEELAVVLARSNDETGAEKLLELFSSTPKNRRAALFLRVLNALYVPPAPPVEKALLQIMEELDLSDAAGFGTSHLPVAAAVKRRCAAQVLKRHPESLNALVSSAEAHWLAGETRTARLLAEEVFDKFSQLDAPKLPTLRRVRELGMVYAAFPGEDERAGAVARDTALAAIQRDRKLLGDTPGRRLLAAILLENAEDHDAAFELLAAAWRKGNRDLATFKMLEELTLRTGRFREFSALLEGHTPKDQMTEVLYRRRLIQLLRDTGRHGEALTHLSALPDALRRREKLQLLAAAPDDRRYAWELRRFLLEEARDPRFSGYFYSDFGTGGVCGAALRRRTLAAPSDAKETAAAVEYLLLGTVVSDPAFSALLSLRREIGGARATKFPPEVMSTPGGAVLRAVSGEKLSSADLKLIRSVCRSPAVPASTAEQLLACLPADERPRAAEELAARMLAARLTERDLELLERVIRRCDTPGRARLAKSAAHASGFGDGYRFRLRLDALLRRSGVGEAWIESDRFAPPGCEWALVASPLPLERRLADFFAATGRAPEWRDVIPLLDVDTGKNLPEAVEKAIGDAVRRRLIAKAEAVKSFCLLALADPERKAHWLELAGRYDTVSGEASLWRLDALDGEAKQQLFERLRRAGRLPPAREHRLDPPNHPNKEQEP